MNIQRKRYLLLLFMLLSMLLFALPVNAASSGGFKEWARVDHPKLKVYPDGVGLERCDEDDEWVNAAPWPKRYGTPSQCPSLAGMGWQTFTQLVMNSFKQCSYELFGKHGQLVWDYIMTKWTKRPHGPANYSDPLEWYKILASVPMDKHALELFKTILTSNKYTDTFVAKKIFDSSTLWTAFVKCGSQAFVRSLPLTPSTKQALYDYIDLIDHIKSGTWDLGKNIYEKVWKEFHWGSGVVGGTAQLSTLKDRYNKSSKIYQKWDWYQELFLHHRADYMSSIVFKGLKECKPGDVKQKKDSFHNQATVFLQELRDEGAFYERSYMCTLYLFLPDGADLNAIPSLVDLKKARRTIRMLAKGKSNIEGIKDASHIPLFWSGKQFLKYDREQCKMANIMADFHREWESSWSNTYKKLEEERQQYVKKFKKLAADYKKAIRECKPITEIDAIYAEMETIGQHECGHGLDPAYWKKILEATYTPEEKEVLERLESFPKECSDEAVADVRGALKTFQGYGEMTNLRCLVKEALDKEDYEAKIGALETDIATVKGFISNLPDDDRLLDIVTSSCDISAAKAVVNEQHEKFRSLQVNPLCLKVDTGFGEEFAVWMKEKNKYIDDLSKGMDHNIAEKEQISEVGSHLAALKRAAEATKIRISQIEDKAKLLKGKYHQVEDYEIAAFQAAQKIIKAKPSAEKLARDICEKADKVINATSAEKAKLLLEQVQTQMGSLMQLRNDSAESFKEVQKAADKAEQIASQYTSLPGGMESVKGELSTHRSALDAVGRDIAKTKAAIQQLEALPAESQSSAPMGPDACWEVVREKLSVLEKEYSVLKDIMQELVDKVVAIDVEKEWIDKIKKSAAGARVSANSADPFFEVDQYATDAEKCAARARDDVAQKSQATLDKDVTAAIQGCQFDMAMGLIAQMSDDPLKKALLKGYDTAKKSDDKARALFKSAQGLYRACKYNDTITTLNKAIDETPCTDYKDFLRKKVAKTEKVAKLHNEARALYKEAQGLYKKCSLKEAMGKLQTAIAKTPCEKYKSFLDEKITKVQGHLDIENQLKVYVNKANGYYKECEYDMALIQLLGAEGIAECKKHKKSIEKKRKIVDKAKALNLEALSLSRAAIQHKRDGQLGVACERLEKAEGLTRCTETKKDLVRRIINYQCGATLSPQEQVARMDCSSIGGPRAAKAYWDAGEKRAKCKCRTGYAPVGGQCKPTRDTLVRGLDCSRLPNTRKGWDRANNRAACFCINKNYIPRRGGGGCVKKPTRGGRVRGGGPRCVCPTGTVPSETFGQSGCIYPRTGKKVSEVCN